ncbi:MAG: glycosyltransferase family 2 protein [Flavobacteriales bacterium]
MQNSIIDVIIPAYNEEKSIPLVIEAIPKKIIRNIVVSNNASTDNTAEVASNLGTIVVTENKKGYGAACLKAMKYIADGEVKPDIIVFLDADFSDYPDEMINLIELIEKNLADMVIGSRIKRKREKGSMMPQQIFGNWLATFLMRILYGYKYTDLGPFRAIRYNTLIELNMQDTNYGWTVEMQLKAKRLNKRVCEIPVSYRKRVGVSKVSGTVKGTIMAGYKIILTIFKYRK